MQVKNDSQKLETGLRWAARILSLPAILFALAHLVSVIFPEAEGGGDASVRWYEWLAVGSLFASAFALIVAWWKESIGGWASLGLMVASMVIYSMYTGEFFPAWYILLAGLALPAALFLMAYRMHNQPTI